MQQETSQYPAHGFHESLPKGKASGSLSVTGNTVVYNSGEQTIRFRLRPAVCWKSCFRIMQAVPFKAGSTLRAGSPDTGKKLLPGITMALSKAPAPNFHKNMIIIITE